jgi:Ca2+-transporting ATPase
MGNGTEAAKNVAKIVIADNNFRLIVNGISNARVISDNIRKLIYYLVSISFLEVFFIFFVILAALPLPLAAVQILWINIVAGGIQDKIFIFIKGEGNVMIRRPRNPKRQFFDQKQMVSILTFSLTLGLSIFLLYLYLIPLYSPKIVSTIIFTSIVFAQLANGIQAQKEFEPFFKNIDLSFSINPYLFIVLALGIGLQLIAIYLIPSWFHIEPLPLTLWKYPVFLFFISFGLVEVKKWVEHIRSA